MLEADEQPAASLPDQACYLELQLFRVLPAGPTARRCRGQGCSEQKAHVMPALLCPPRRRDVSADTRTAARPPQSGKAALCTSSIFYG